MSEHTPHCPTCRCAPPEPPDGTWVRDRYDRLHHRKGDRWGLPGYHYLGVWHKIWLHSGPLVECEPYSGAIPDDGRTIWDQLTPNAPPVHIPIPGKRIHRTKVRLPPIDD